MVLSGPCMWCGWCSSVMIPTAVFTAVVTPLLPLILVALLVAFLVVQTGPEALIDNR